MVQSVARAIDLLELLKQSARPMSIAELSVGAGLQPSTAHRILQTLCEYNYAYKDEPTHLYQLGPALIPLGVTAARGVDLRKMGTPVLERLSQQTGEDAYLMIISGHYGLVLSQVDGPNDLRVVEKFGYEVELHCGGIRKALLAHQPQEFIDDYVHFCKVAPLQHPLRDPEALRKELEGIRQNGYGLTVNDYVQGAMGIGAPVFGADGRAVASMGVIVPLSRARGREDGLIRQVRANAADLGRRLGYAPPRLG